MGSSANIADETTPQSNANPAAQMTTQRTKRQGSESDANQTDKTTKQKTITTRQLWQHDNSRPPPSSHQHPQRRVNTIATMWTQASAPAAREISAMTTGDIDDYDGWYWQQQKMTMISTTTPVSMTPAFMFFNCKYTMYLVPRLNVLYLI